MRDADNCYGTDELTAFFDDIKLNEVSRTIFPETDLTQFQLSGGGVQYCLDFGPMPDCIRIATSGSMKMLWGIF
jgi:hypothetical protein